LKDTECSQTQQTAKQGSKMLHFILGIFVNVADIYDTTRLNIVRPSLRSKGIISSQLSDLRAADGSKFRQLSTLLQGLATAKNGEHAYYCQSLHTGGCGWVKGDPKTMKSEFGHDIQACRYCETEITGFKIN
jgi:hypothetical protein